MATHCERCKVLEKQKYRVELDKNKSFFKIMMNDFRRRLQIPQRFVTSFKNSNKLLGRKFLTGPSGKTWLVEVKRTAEDDFVFCNGWEIFVKDHCLDDADLLVFKMDGFSAFDVMIFDPSACEKEETSFVKKYKQQSSEDELSCEEINYGYDDDDTTDEEDSIQEVTRRKSSRGKQYQFHEPQPSKGREKKKILVAKQDNRKRKCTPSSSRKQSSEEEPSCEQINCGYDDDDTTDEEDNIQELTRRKSSPGKQYVFHSPQPSKGRKKKKNLVAKQDNRKRKCTPLSSRNQNVEPEENRSSYSNRRQVPEKEKIKVYQQASRHTSSVPCVLMKMKPTHVYMGQLKLPKAWAQEHMRQISETITLRIPSTRRTWPASIRCRMEGLVIQSGWEDFVMDNRLDEFDVCVFELAQGGTHNSKPVILDVHIYPVENEIIRPL